MGSGGVGRAEREGILVRGKRVRFCMFIVTAMGESNIELGKDWALGLIGLSKVAGLVLKQIYPKNIPS